MLYYSTIEPETLELLKKLQQLSSLQNTRLVGGTSLALQIGHRISIDIDLFGNITAEEDILIEELKTLGTLKIIKNSKNVRIYLLNNIKVDLVNYAYPWLENAVYEDDICMAGLKDIAAMKLAAVTGRGSKKDFIDICFLSRKYTLKEMLSFYAEKYPEVSDFMVLKSLSYFEDAEQDPNPNMQQNLTWEQAKKQILSLL
jgi:hypothetical protein